MKLNNILCSSLAILALASCSDKMDYNEYNIYDKDYVSKTFNNVGAL